MSVSLAQFYHQEPTSNTNEEGQKTSPTPRDQMATTIENEVDPRDLETISIDGWLRKKNRDGIPSLRGWKKRYFVLHAGKRELRYFESMKESTYGNVPLKEKGCIDLRLLKYIDTSASKKRGGSRFDIHLNCSADCGRYLLGHRDDLRTGSRSVVPHTLGSKESGVPTRVISLEASSCAEKVEWVKELSCFLPRQGTSKGAKDSSNSRPSRKNLSP